MKIAFGLAVVLFLVTCEQKQLERDSSFKADKDIFTLNENNYINQAKYSQIKHQVNNELEPVSHYFIGVRVMTRDGERSMIS